MAAAPRHARLQPAATGEGRVEPCFHRHELDGASATEIAVIFTNTGYGGDRPHGQRREGYPTDHTKGAQMQIDNIEDDIRSQGMPERGEENCKSPPPPRPDQREFPAEVQRGAICTMAKPPSPNIRLTITVTPEVHATFARMATAASMPIGRAMGEWLADTLEGVEFVTAQLVKAREAPRQVVKEMRQMALGSADEMEQLLADMRSGKLKLPPAEGTGGPRPAAAGSPRPVIRGGKSPTAGKNTNVRATRGSK